MTTNITDTGSRQPTDGSDENTDDVRELLNLVTQETRFTLIQNIVGHPKEMPSLKELDYVNPSKSKSTIRDHLDQLIAAGIVESVELADDHRQRDLPYRFYRLTDSARQFLADHELLRAEDTLQQMYSMLETTPQIEKYLDAPRPGDERDTDETAHTAQH